MLKIGRAALALAVGSVIAFSGKAIADAPERDWSESPTQTMVTSSASPTAEAPEPSDSPSAQPPSSDTSEPSPSPTDSEQAPDPASPTTDPTSTPTPAATPTGTTPTAIAAPAAPAVPRTLTARAASAIPGTGKRVFFDISDQQVWLVTPEGTVARTYLVSGSRYDQLKPGTYKVFSKSAKTTSWNSRATMNYMVRFTRGQNAAIGFHDIPRYPNGKQAQTLSQLGLPLSDGCIRQRASDAKALWEFAPVGTTVVVTR
jgi:lipoprotein-anchoring transpeptidase ErfK/SrfK